MIERVGVERKLFGKWAPVDSFMVTGKQHWTLEEALAWCREAPDRVDSGVEFYVFVNLRPGQK